MSKNHRHAESRKSVERRTRSALLDYIDLLKGILEGVEEAQGQPASEPARARPVEVDGQIGAIVYPTLGTNTVEAHESIGFEFGRQVAQAGEELNSRELAKAPASWSFGVVRGYNAEVAKMKSESPPPNGKEADHATASVMEAPSERKDTAP